jgi:hypothetical protein
LQQPIALSDSEMEAVLSAAQPLDYCDRAAFLEAVAGELRHHETIGPGVVFRVVRTLQKRFLRPPLETDVRVGVSKHARDLV